MIFLVFGFFLSGFPSSSLLDWAAKNFSERNIVDLMYLAKKDPNVIDKGLVNLLYPRVEKAQAETTYQIQTGYYIGNGASKSITGLGFKPEMVILKPNTQAGGGAAWKSTAMNTMNRAYFIGTTDVTTGDIKLESDGFTVLGANTDTVNVRHTWIAFAGSDCSASGTMCIGTYIGNGTSPRAIATGFDPNLVWVKPLAATTGNWRSSSMPDNYAQYFTATAQSTDGALFTTFGSGVFTVGATNNTASTVYYYVAFKEVAGSIDVGTYAGQATAQPITGVGFQPDFVFVKNATSAVAPIYNVNESYGNSSSYYTDAVNVVGGITSLDADGFSVGTGTTANGSGSTFYYAAFGGANDTRTSSGTFKMASGTYTGVGATGNYITVQNLDFAPDLVIVKGNTTVAGCFRTSQMAGDTTYYLDSATTYFTGGIIALNQNGFTIGASTVTNTSGVTYYWTAYGNAWKPETNSGAADFYVGAYYGNGIDSRNITRLPYQADMVTIRLYSGTNNAVFRTSAMSGDYSGYFSGTAEAANLIQELRSDGFQIGTLADVNTAAGHYFYFGFKTGTNFSVGTYSGTGSQLDITTVGFQPDNLWIKHTGTTRGVQRTSNMATDSALPFLNVANLTSAVTALLSNGFRVLSAAETNTSGTDNYRYVAWKNNYTPTSPTFNVQTGYYIGNGASKSITGLGFKPEMVILKPNTQAGGGAAWKSTAMNTMNRAYFIGTTDVTTGDIKLESDGFTVLGANTDTVNVRHTWIAFAGSDCSASGTMCIGTYIGNGTSPRAIATGFDPNLVWVKPLAATTGNWRSSSMPDNYAQYFTATAQSTDGALFTTFGSGVFTVGATNNTASTVYYYVAFKEVAGSIDVGTYAGQATAQPITGVGFQPDFVFVKNATSAVAPIYNVNESYGNSSSYYTDAVNVVGGITSLDADGFSVGTGTTANGSGSTFYYAAFGGANDTRTSSGTFKMASGTYTGVGATGNYITVQNLDFAPDLVIVKGNTTVAGCFRTSQMAGDTTYYLDSATTYFTGGIIALNQNGFTIGASTVTNTSGVTYYWTAYGNAWKPETNSGAADFYVGAYYGNGIDSRNITRLPYQADMVTIRLYSGTNNAVFRTSAMSGDYSGYFSGTAEAANLIQELRSDGFQIGTLADVNTAAGHYFYFGFKTGTNFSVGTYSGTGSQLDITTVGFQPDNLWIKHTGTTRGVQRTSNMATDSALPFLNVANLTSAVTALLSNGFRVLSAAETNTSGTDNYRYVAWQAKTYNQSAYRWFENTDTTDVGTPLALQDTAVTLGSTGAAFRLRMLLHIGDGTLSANGQNFKLQFAEKSGDCDTSFSGETYNDVTADTDIAYNNNSPDDGDALTPNADDPAHSGHTRVDQTYEELNNFTNSQAAVPSGQDGKWDFALKDNSAPANTIYCLRVVKSNDATLDTYTVIPEITTAAGGNTAPEVDNVQLNSQSSISLTEGGTEPVSATADVSDAQGCNTITGVIAKIYRSGVSGGKDCTPDNDNNCYSVASCTETSCSGTDATYSCAINMQFHADPTDGSAEYWRAYIEATDGELTGFNYSPADAPDVITLQALNVTATIGYGGLDPGQNTGSTNQETTVTNTGNSAIDIRLYGTDMTWSGNIIDAANQEYSLSGFTYGAGTDLKEGPSYDDVNADLPKPIQSPSNSSDIFYWGIGVPSLTPAGPYQGTNTFEAINAL